MLSYGGGRFESGVMHEVFLAIWFAFKMLLSFAVVLAGVSVFVVAAREDGLATVLPWYALPVSIDHRKIYGNL